MKDYKNESRAIEENIIEVCYEMKGGLTWDEAWSISPEQRHRIVEFLNRKMKERIKAMTGKEYM